MFDFIRDLRRRDHKPRFGGLDILKYIGPGLLVTVGFIDPGNWVTNVAAGSQFGYQLLWVVSLSTVILIFNGYVLSAFCLLSSRKTLLVTTIFSGFVAWFLPYNFQTIFKQTLKKWLI